MSGARGAPDGVGGAPRRASGASVGPWAAVHGEQPPVPQGTEGTPDRLSPNPPRRMNCREFRRKHDAYVDDTLSGVEHRGDGAAPAALRAVRRSSTRASAARCCSRTTCRRSSRPRFTERLQMRLAHERALQARQHGAAGTMTASDDAPPGPVLDGTYVALAAGIALAAGLDDERERSRATPTPRFVSRRCVASAPEPEPSPLADAGDGRLDAGGHADLARRVRRTAGALASRRATSRDADALTLTPQRHRRGRRGVRPSYISAMASAGGESAPRRAQEARLRSRLLLLRGRRFPEGRRRSASWSTRPSIRRRATSISRSAAASELDAEALDALLSTPPMLAERRVVVMRDVDKLKKDARALLDRYLARPAHDTVLVLVAPAGAKADKALSDRATAVEFAPLTGDRAAEVDRASRASTVLGRTITPEAVALLHRGGGRRSGAARRGAREARELLDRRRSTSAPCRTSSACGAARRSAISSTPSPRGRGGRARR